MITEQKKIQKLANAVARKQGGRPKKFHSEQHDDELFNRVCINAINGIDVKSLSKTDFITHQKWVEDNWDDLNAE